MSFAANCFSRDIDDMISMLCCSIDAIIVVEAISNLQELSIGGDFVVAENGKY